MNVTLSLDDKLVKEVRKIAVEQDGVVSHFAFSASRQELAFDDFVRKLHLEIRNLGRWTRFFRSQLVVGLIREYSEYERWKRRVKTFGLIVIIKLDHVGIADGDLV